MRRHYNEYNYCNGCELKHPKDVTRCVICNQKLRTKTKYPGASARHRARLLMEEQKQTILVKI